MNTSPPLVSVVMPVYNAAPFIREAIESILDQTFTEFDFVIVDDASTDNSFGIIKEYLKKDGRIVVIRNEKNLQYHVLQPVRIFRKTYGKSLRELDMVKPKPISAWLKKPEMQRQSGLLLPRTAQMPYQ